MPPRRPFCTLFLGHYTRFVVVASFSNWMEVVMTYESRRLAGILLILLPGVMFGGARILSFLIGDPAYVENPLRQDLSSDIGK